MRAGLVGLLLLVARPALADETVLFVAPGLPAEEAASLADALRAELALDVVDDTRARVLLTEQAAALPPDRAGALASAAIEEAEAAWADLRLDEARALVERALAGVLSAPRPPPVALVARALFVRSLIDAAAGRSVEAARALDAALALDAGLTASPDRHGPPVLRAVEAARRRGRPAPDAVLRVVGVPAGASLELDGAAFAGPEARVASGPHLLVARALGHRSSALLIDVAGTTERALSLEPAPAALAAQQVLEVLAVDDATTEVLVVAAQALGIPRVLEAVATAPGQTEIRVWSAAGARLATLPDPRRRLPSARQAAARAPRSGEASRVGAAPERSSSSTWWWVGAATVAVGAVVATVLLASASDPEARDRILVTGPE